MTDIANLVPLQTRMDGVTMDHVAYMKKSWGLIPKILSGEKKIESRWYKSKKDPWDNVNPGDNVYFKDSGEPVTVQAEVSKVLQFANLDEKSMRVIINEYGNDIGFDEGDTDELVNDELEGKKYCILIFLKEPKKVDPFEIDKTGYGMGSAWICVPDINSIRKDL